MKTLKLFGLSVAILVCACTETKDIVGITEEGNAVAELSSSSTIPGAQSSSSSYTGIPSSSSEGPSIGDSRPYVYWVGSESIYQIDTGEDAGYETSGYWYTYTDGYDGGASSVTWPVESGNEYSGDVIDPIIDYCGGLCGTITLDRGTLTSDPFVGFAFNVAGEDDRYVALPADVTKWGGVCITYTSDFAINVKLGLGDSLEAAINYDLPYVSFDAAPMDSVSRCAEWSEFKQKNSDEITGEQVATQLVSIHFVFVGESGMTGQVNIMAFRSKDSLPE